MKPKITFVLPGYSKAPVGGYKIVFEYANQLADDGYNICILYLNNTHLRKYKIPEFFKKAIIEFYTQVEPTWFRLNKNIQKISSRNKRALTKISDSDIVIATAAITAKFVKNNFEKAKKYYLIQGFEKWDMTEAELYQTYNFGFTNIVISKWLYSIVSAHTPIPPVYIPNSIDIKIYKLRKKLNERLNPEIGVLYHPNPVKGSKYALEALKIVKNHIPDLQVKMFGTLNPPKNLPQWITYYKNASQEQTVKIYNSVKVFLSSSVEEGFGLTGLEAMACGATLVSTNYTGVREYARNGYNSILSPVKNSDILADNLILILKNDKERIRLAQNGIKTAKNFSIGKNYKKFKATILR